MQEFTDVEFQSFHIKHISRLKSLLAFEHSCASVVSSGNGL